MKDRVSVSQNEVTEMDGVILCNILNAFYTELYT